MGQTIVIELDVQSGELDQLNKDLEKTKNNLNETEQSSKKASTGLKSVGDNGGAIAVLDSLTEGLATRVRDAAEASKVFNISLKGTRTALIATGIGAFVVALGLVVSYWDEIVEFVTQANSRLEKQIKILENINKEYDYQLKINKQRQKLSDIENKSKDELVKKERSLLVAQLNNLEVLAKQLEVQLEIENSKIREVTLVEKGLVALKAYVFGYQTVGASVADSLGFDVMAEAQGKLKDLTLQIGDIKNAIAEIDNPDVDPSNQGEQTEQVSGVLDEGNVDNFFTGSLERLNEDATNALDIEAAFLEKRLALQEVTEEEITEMKRRQSEIRQEIESIENRQKLEVTAQTMGQVAQLFGEASTVGKAAGSAQALINAYLGVTSVLANPTTIPEPFGTISKIASAGVVLANGLKAVQQINSVKTPSGGGGGVSVGGFGGGLSAPSSPSFNVVGNTGINQIGQAIGENNDEPTRAYVVFDDVKKASDIDRDSVRESSF